MRTRAALGLVLAVSLIAALFGPAASATVAMQRVVVVLSDSVSRPRVAADDLVRRTGGTLSQVWTVALKGFAAEIPAAAVDALSRDPRVAIVETDRIFTALGEIPTGIDRIEADKKLSLTSTTKNYAGNGVGVAVIDSGIAAHPELNIVGGTNCARWAGCADGLPGDGNGHGTHVAGTIGAKDDGTGVVGVVPNIDLYAVKVLDNRGSGYLSWIISGLNWVAARAGTIDVANMSLGAPGSDTALEDAVRATITAGVTVVVAAGNSADDANNFTPARVVAAITVAAVADGDGLGGGAGTAAITCRSGEVDDRLATFSNYGSVVDIAAPGVCITSTWKNGGYNTISGTSMAAPHVTGAAALYKSENSSATPAAIQTALKGSWSVAQNDASCGYTSYSGRTGGPLLMLNPCDTASGGGGTVVTVPGAFNKITPTDNATGLGTKVKFTWGASSGATGYVLQLFDSNSTLLQSFSTTGTSITILRLSTATTYKWQVVASNAGGTTTASNGLWTFRTA